MDIVAIADLRKKRVDQGCLTYTRLSGDKHELPLAVQCFI
jgi:hypothetical protein